MTYEGIAKLTLLGANTYTGTTTISSGTLQLGNGGTSGSISNTNSVINSGTLIFNRSDMLTFNALISGTGAITQQGSGTTILTVANNYTGGTLISMGTLQVGTAPGSTVSIGGNTTTIDPTGTLSGYGIKGQELGRNSALVKAGTVLMCGKNWRDLSSKLCLIKSSSIKNYVIKRSPIKILYKEVKH